MAKKKNMEALPTLGGIFCLFVVFLNCLSLLGSLPIRLSSLLLPSLWLLLGVCLMTTRKNWLIVVGLLPLTILMVQQAAFPLPLDDLTALVHALLGRLLPGIGYGVCCFWCCFPLPTRRWDCAEASGGCLCCWCCQAAFCSIPAHWFGRSLV